MKSKFLILSMKRFGASIIVIFLLITFVFILLRLAPGDPTQKFVSPYFSKELSGKVKESFGLDDSIVEQYSKFMINFVQGDFGISYTFRKGVDEVIGDTFPYTALLAASAFLLQVIFSILLTSFVWKRSSLIQDSVDRIMLILYSIPSFLMGMLLLYLFAFLLDWFPSSGISDTFYAEEGFFIDFWNKLYHLILPSFSIAVGGTIVFYRYLNDQIATIFNESFILKLKSDGFTDMEIFIRHIIPNSVGPLITISGIELGVLFTGALITEVVFALPGMGRLTVEAILSRDYPLVVGCTIFIASFVIFANFIADFLRSILDKRYMEKMII